jgi:hypothetical protein
LKIQIYGVNSRKNEMKLYPDKEGYKAWHINREIKLVNAMANKCF